MKIEDFKDIDVNHMNFRQIFSIYDAQFKAIRDFLMRLGDKYHVEIFTDSDNDIITLEHAYSVGRGQTMLYLNGVIQFEGIGYREVTSNTLKLLFDRDVSDEISVVICNSLLLNENVESYLDSIKEMSDAAKDNMNLINTLTSKLNLMKDEIENKGNEIIKNRLDVQDSYALILKALSSELGYKPSRVYKSVEDMVSDNNPSEDYGVILVLDEKNDKGRIFLRVSSYIKGRYPGYLPLGISFNPADLRGYRGIRGEKGDKGDDGRTPIIGDNGNWFFEAEDTGIRAVARDGETPRINTETGTWFYGEEDTGIRAVARDGETPRINTETGTWFYGEEDTGVNAIGVNGETPRINAETGTWFYGSSDTGVRAVAKDGRPGSDGVTPRISIGEVVTVPYGSSSYATITGSAENPVLNLGLEKGERGGSTAVVDILYNGTDSDVMSVELGEDFRANYNYIQVVVSIDGKLVTSGFMSTDIYLEEISSNINCPSFTDTGSRLIMCMCTLDSNNIVSMSEPLSWNTGVTNSTSNIPCTIRRIIGIKL